MPGKRKLEEKWSLTEKKQLKQGIERCGKDDLDKLHAYVPTKTKIELGTFIKKLKMQEPYYEKKMQETSQERACLVTSPIEMWLQMAEDLTEYETDYSFVLGQVMQIIEHLEPKQELPSTTGNPDFGKIYGYIRAIMSNQEHPELAPIEAAVILDILSQLASHIKGSDTTEQRKLMLEKYKAMKVMVDPENKQEGYKTIQKALTDDTASYPSTSKDTETFASPRTTESSETSDNQEITKSEKNAGETMGRISATVTIQSEIGKTTGSANQKGEMSTSVQESSNRKDISETASQSENITANETANQSGEKDRTANQSDEKEVTSPNLKQKSKASKPAKTQLYSLNPFCIPVKYLNPEKKKIN